MVTAQKSFLSDLIDYAGLFPPAQLPLPEVAQNYHSYLEGPHAWMLARLVLPIQLASELEQQPPFVNSKQSWKISALIPELNAEYGPFLDAVLQIDEFNRRHRSSGHRIDTVEVKAQTLQQVVETIRRLPAGLQTFIEICPGAELEDELAAIANQSGCFAKIRMGGVEREMIPATESVAQFILACVRQNVGFKATAGLHHPLRGEYRLTYNVDSDVSCMFGFINVFAAACLAFANPMPLPTLVDILSESDPDAFHFNQSLSWRDHTLSWQQIEAIRGTRAISFGSCSFTEPIDELTRLGLFARPDRNSHV